MGMQGERSGLSGLLVMARNKKQVKILWSAKDHPSLHSGYGVMGYHLLPRLADRYGKKNIVIYAPVFQQAGQGEWEGMKVLAGTKMDYGENMIYDHWREERPTFLLQVGDWGGLREIPQLAAEDKLRYVGWHPFDFVSLPAQTIAATVRFAWKVVPWTEYAYKKFTGPPYNLGNVARSIPLGVDVNVWKPGLDRKDLPLVMKSMGFGYEPNAYNILLVGANQRRKYLAEQIHAVGMFRKAHPEIAVHLYLHTMMGGEVDLAGALDGAGLEGAYAYASPYVMSQGGLREDQMVKLYTCADVVLNCALEGFGLSMVQAQALGVPVITLAEGPGPEIVRFGATVPTQELDLETPSAPKALPSPIMIGLALETLLDSRGQRSDEAVRHVRETYSWDRVAVQWFDLIEGTLLPELSKYSMEVPATTSAVLRRRARQLVELKGV